MYVGDGKLRHVAVFLDGFINGLGACGVESPMSVWSRWVELRFGIWDCAWHWTSILIHAFGDEPSALRALPSLYREYIAAVERDGVDGVERGHEERFPRTGGLSFAPGVSPPGGCGV